MPPPVEIFYFHSEKDRDLLEKLREHLAAMQTAGMIQERVGPLPGQDREEYTNQHLGSATIFLIIVSASFIASEHCYGDQLRRAIERHDKGDACVIPVLLQPCLWEDTPFGKLSSLPGGGKFVKVSGSDIEAAFREVAVGIRKVVKDIIEMGRVPSLLPTPPSNLEVHSILPYLCDRQPQEKNLKDALKPYVPVKRDDSKRVAVDEPPANEVRPQPDAQEEEEEEKRKTSSPPLPLACIIHGKKDENPDAFWERLREKSLPVAFRIDRRKHFIVDYYLAVQQKDADRASLVRSLHESLESQVIKDEEAEPDERKSKERMLREFAVLRVPVVIRLHVDAGSWNRHRRSMVEAFLDFCNSWPTLPMGLVLIHCLVVRYENLNVWFYKRWKHAWRRQQARKFFDKLNASNFSDYPNMRGVVLPELEPIEQGEVFDWLNSGDDFQFCANHTTRYCNPAQVYSALTPLYQDPKVRIVDSQTPKVPMEPLAGQLLEALKKNRCA